MLSHEKFLKTSSDNGYTYQSQIGFYLLRAIHPLRQAGGCSREGTHHLFHGNGLPSLFRGGTKRGYSEKLFSIGRRHVAEGVCGSLPTIHRNRTLEKIITETVEDANFPNGEKRLDSVAESNVVLWSGNSDNGLDTEDESELLPFRYGYSAYELAKIHGYEGTEEEYALAPLLAINELENYAKKDLSNVDEAEFAYKNVLPTSVWECRLDDDPETATPGIRDFWK